MLASSCKVPVMAEEVLGMSNTASSSQHLPVNIHYYTKQSKKPQPRSPDLIELSDTGPSPVSGIEDDSSPPMTDADSEDHRGDTESPTPTNSAANISHTCYWQGEEHRELLATEGEEEEEEEDDDESSGEVEADENDEELLNANNSSDSELPTSAENSDNETNTKESIEGGDDIEDDEIWHIQPEQLTYYVGQFHSLQSDSRALINGTQAKQFFEKSRLPTSELSKIWQLSDVTRDGALSLAEFCTAMHLVVLRRNNIPLPNVLPPVLEPGSLSLSFYLQPVTKTSNAMPQRPVKPGEAPEDPQQFSASQQEGSQWTKFVDSPTSSLASPGPRPVNFDFPRSQLEQDPRILHPVAVRLTPESQHADSVAASTGPSSLPAHTTVTSSSSAPSSTAAPIGGGKKVAPPPPPPRPNRGHARSSSLDLNQLGNRNGNGSVVYPFAIPPAVPPRISPNVGSPRKDSDVMVSGAFHVYRRPASNSKANSVQAGEARAPASGSGRSLLTVISAHEQRNQVLRQQQMLMAKQLAELQEERVGLELRMNNMKLQSKH